MIPALISARLQSRWRLIRFVTGIGREHWPLLGAIAVFLVAGLYQIGLPGLYADEAIQAAPAARIATGDLGTAIAANPSDLHLWGRVWPTFVLTYIGPVKTYVLALSFYLFGISVPVLRATTLACGLAGLVFAYLFLRRAFDRRVAAIGVLLLGTDSSLILFSRTDWGPIAIAFAAKTAGLYGLLRWWRNKGDWVSAGLAGLLFGIGFSHKADFDWFLVALVGAAMIYLPEVRAAARSAVPGAAAAVAGFLFGSLPMLIFNATRGWLTWQEPNRQLASVLDSLYPETAMPLALVRYAASQAVNRFELLADVVDGQIFPYWTVAYSSPVLEYLHLGLFLLALAVAVLALRALMIRRRSFRAVKPAVFFALVAIITFAEILVTPSSTGPHHSIGLYPFPQFVMALGLSALPPFRLRRIPARVLVVGLIVALVLVNVVQLAAFHRAAAETGGRGIWSDAIYGAAGFIDQTYPDDPIVATDWGFHDQLTVLFGTKRQVFFWTPDARPAEEFKAQLDAGHTLFVLYAERHSRVFKQQRQRLMSLLGDPALSEVRWHTLSDRTGESVILLAKVTPKQ